MKKNIIKRTVNDIEKDSIKFIKNFKEKNNFEICERTASLIEKDPILGASILSTISTFEKDECFYMYDIFENEKYNISFVGRKIIKECLDEVDKINEKILGFDLSKKRANLKDCLIKVKRNGITNYLYDFNKATHVLEKTYGFNFRGIYGNLETDIVKKNILELGFTKEEYKIGYNTPPLEENDVARIFFIFSHYIGSCGRWRHTIPVIPYIDHWHYLLNEDFVELKRGGKNYMSIYVKDEDPIFAKIREIYYLECSKACDGEFILFEVDW